MSMYSLRVVWRSDCGTEIRAEGAGSTLAYAMDVVENRLKLLGAVSKGEDPTAVSTPPEEHHQGFGHSGTGPSPPATRMADKLTGEGQEQ